MMNEAPHGFRFSLATLLLVVCIVSVVAAFPVTLMFFVWLAPLCGPVLGLCLGFVVWHAARPQNSAHRWPPVLGWFAACLALLLVLGCWFIRHRWINGFDDNAWPRPFPYPDLLLLEIHDWWDRLHPAPAGSLKIDGEFYAVLLGANALFLFACLVCGVVCGRVLRTCDLAAVVRLAAPKRGASFLRWRLGEDRLLASDDSDKSMSSDDD